MREAWRRLWPLLLLSFLAGSRWLAVDRWSTVDGTAASAGLAALVCAAAAALIPGSRLKSAPAPLLGAGVLAAPLLGTLWTGAAGEPLTRVAMLCFVPVLAAFLHTVRSARSKELAVAPGLTAVAGALLLFPLTLPATVADYIGCALPPLGVALAVSGKKRASRTHSRFGFSLFFAAAAVVLIAIETARTVLHHIPWSRPAWPAVPIDVVLAALTCIALQRAGNRRFVAVFLLTPAVTTIEGLILVSPGLLWRPIAGVVLLLSGAVLLWREHPADALSLR